MRKQNDLLPFWLREEWMRAMAKCRNYPRHRD